MFVVLTVKQNAARFETLAPRFLSRDAWRLDQRGSCRAKISQQVMLDPSLVKEI